MQYMFTVFLFLIPICAVAYWVYALVKYVKAKKSTDSLEPEKKKSLKIQLTVSSIVAGVLVAAVAGICVLMFMALAYM